jgi:hypothetical protein
MGRHWTKAALTGKEGVDFVRCRICGDHRRVISGCHLSIHEIDREAYMNEYRLSPDQLIAKDFRRIQSSRRDFQPHGKNEWVQAIKTVYNKLGKLNTRTLARRYANLYHQGVWIYGDWNKALHAAGFEPETIRQKKQWTTEKVINAICQRRKRRLPLNDRSVMRSSPALHHAARRRFKTWDDALRAAGVAEIKVTSRPDILKALRDTRARHSKKAIPAMLRLQADQYFGSLRKAIAELKRDRRVLDQWSRRKS